MTVLRTTNFARFIITARWAACVVLACVVGCSKTPVAELASQLSDANHEVRYEAAKKLEEFGPEAVEAASELAQGLSDADPRIRYRSAKVLSKIGIGASVAANELAAALQQEALQPQTRYYVVKTLANIEEFAVVAMPALISTLEGSDEAKTRYYAAKALGKIGRDAQTSVTALEAAAKDSDPKLRKAAAEALAKVRPS